MSISGLHVTMVSGLMFSLVYGIWRRTGRFTLWLPARKAAAVAGLLAALGYALLAGFAVPAQRTVYMLGVVAIALWLGRFTSATAVLTWALLAVTLFDPWAVLSPGFWLSFGAIATIMLVSAGRIGRMHWLADWARIQWAITLGLIPALLSMFQQISLVSPVANAIAVPLVSLVVVPLTLLGNPAITRFHVGACSRHIERLHGPHAMDERFTARGLEPACATHVGSRGRDHGYYMDAVAGSLGLLSGFPARWLGIVALLPHVSGCFHRSPGRGNCGLQCWMSGRDWPLWPVRKITRCSTIPGRVPVLSRIAVTARLFLFCEERG